MKNKIIAIISLFCLLSSPVIAQTITGKIVDEKQKPLPYIGIILSTLPDSVYVASTVSRSDGSFELSAIEGEKYSILLSFLGYEPIRKSCEVGSLGTLVMKEDVQVIKEVVVIAQRTKHSADGYTVNLRASDIVKGKQTADALTFLPGVTKEDTRLKINGLTVSEIYVDGVKLTNLDELNRLPADMIDKVKVNYLAGGNQNASASGGTIDITLRQPPKGGFYGSLSAGADYSSKNGISSEDLGGVIYYRYKNLSLYNNLSLNWNNYRESAEQTIWNTSSSLIKQIYEESRIKGFNATNRLSLTQQIDKRSKISGSYYVSTNRQNPFIETVSNDKSTISSQDITLVQEATVKYSSTLNERGASLEVVGDYYNRRASYDSHYLFENEAQKKSYYESSLDLWKLSADITHPLSEKISLKYGASVQLISSAYDPTISESQHFPISVIPTRTKGLIPHAYAQAMGAFWKIQYSVGINWQLNGIEYEELDKIGEKISNTQWGINPTVQMMMPVGESGKNALMFNYKHSLDDIPYAAISSTIRWIDPYNYTVGNPYLKAPTYDILMGGVSLFGNIFNITALYIKANNSIYWETKQSSAEIFYTTPINLPSQEAYGVGVELNLNPICRFGLAQSHCR